MPGYRAHLVGGVASYVIVLATIFSPSVSLITGLQWLGFSLFGALFPDVDTKSKGQLFFYRAMAVAALFLFWQRRFTDIALMCSIGLLPLIVKHRSLTHSLIFLAGLAGFMMVCTAHYAPHYVRMVSYDLVFFLAGAASHILLDFGLRGVGRKNKRRA
jgi:membrane-bound metal-dependent hydrolase YbcI (DUF457 family)